ncbi:type VI secretion system lipoprotein TssJ [Enterovibrio makurazakiensis]|uniref:Type VI secretion system lipoprotein TssJ n=1 Tax=Enterovibrio gelatinilyticus TaxID=2899819 RepID=A0ABT5QZG1_9GAMM|nr:type VI secretion system lipoprotein TssJ [Enterovibrio sp. ZSDZ42]MDD1793396.1 type VI secretion system lipoprotein TssJ [Enterovibrio sp. ZSDZ42]
MLRLIALLVLLQLAGCAGSDLPQDQPTTVTFSIVATGNVNPNISGDATPVEVQVFELEDDSMFLSSDFEQLAEDAEGALKSNYVDHRDYSMVPGQFKFVDEFEIEDDTRYIATMVRYSDPDVSEWKKVVKILPIGRKYHLLFFIDTNEVILDKVE